MTFSLRCSGLFRQSRADASRRQVCFRATHCSNTPGPAVHFHFRLCNSSTFQATPQCHGVFFPPNSAGTRELILLCYFEIHAAYVNYGACWGFQGIFQAVRSAQVIQNDQLKLFFALSVVLPPKKSGSMVQRDSSPISLIGFHQLKLLLKCYEVRFSAATFVLGPLSDRDGGRKEESLKEMNRELPELAFVPKLQLEFKARRFFCCFPLGIINWNTLRPEDLASTLMRLAFQSL